jgi:aspartyl-tRNA(Asn)/glutamyl-tRNA(Gln) amidotransferase subunit B
MPPWKLRGARVCNRTFLALELRFHAETRLFLRAALPLTRTALYATQVPEALPLRKQLKDEAKAKRAAGLNGTSQPSRASQKNVENWELTVGIEIHAQLNTARKLFSREYQHMLPVPN